MEINFENANGYTIIKISGRLDTASYEDAGQRIQKKIAEGEHKIIMDLSEMDYISSSGLRVLLTALKTTKAAGGTIKLCCVQDKIAEVFEISGFKSLFEMNNSLEDALK